MKKGWKVFWITLASLTGLVITTIVIVMWLVLTPARLTSIVNKLSDKFILCESHFGNVDLTLFKTFPFVGLEVDDVLLVNHIEGTPNDTVAKIGSVSVGFNIKEFLKNDNIVVKKLVVDDVDATLFTDSCGNSNFDIFAAGDTLEESEPFEMPELVSLESIRINHLNTVYSDQSNDINASLKDLNLKVDGLYKPDNVKTDVKMDIDGVDMTMISDSSNFTAVLTSLTLKADARSKDDIVDGKLSITVDGGSLSNDGQEMVNDYLNSSKGQLLSIKSDINASLTDNIVNVSNTKVSIKQYELDMEGAVRLPDEQDPMSMNLTFNTNCWNIADLLKMLPVELAEWSKGMDMDADITLKGKIDGSLNDTLMPVVKANLVLKDGKFKDKDLIPYTLTGINGDIDATLDLGENGISAVTVNSLKARSGSNTVSISGTVDDLMGKMYTDANIRGTISLADLKPYLPDEPVMRLEGRADVNMKVKTNWEQLEKSQFDRMKVNGTIGFKNLDVEYDTIFAQIPNATVELNLPAKTKSGFFDDLISATIRCDSISADLPNSDITVNVGNTDLKATLSNIFDSTMPLKIFCDFDLKGLNGNMDSILLNLTNPKGNFAMIPESVTSDRVAYKVNFNSSALHCETNDSTTVDVAGLAIRGGANYDPSKPNTLQQWSPNLDIDFKRGYIDLEQFAYIIQIPDIKFNYKPEKCEIASANIVFGNSDFYLSGAVTGLEKWLSHEDMLKGDLYFTSNYTNVDDLMEAFSGMGSDEDSLEMQRIEDNVDTSAHPFIVPKDVDFTLHTRIKEATAFENDLREVAGDIRIRDGVAALNQVGFVCKAARMQLTGMYHTPRVNHIFVGLDFHLLDINIQELVKMIPYVDTLVPLLNDLEGNADFHLCAETYVNAFYQPKISTMRAASALTGQNLVVLDNKDIDRIAKLLQLKKWREDDTKIHVDSLDVTMTLFRDELEVHPFLLRLHKYGIVAEGYHNLKNNYDYHVELVESPLPIRLAVDVLGTLPKLNFDISPKLRYKNLYRPSRRNDVDKSVLHLQELIVKSLEANVKEDTRNYQGLEGGED